MRFQPDPCYCNACIGVTPRRVSADDYWPADYGTPVVAPEPVPCASTHDWHALAERGLDWYQGMTCADCNALYTYAGETVR